MLESYVRALRSAWRLIYLNDTEMNVVTRDTAIARQSRLRLWAEHLELSVEQVAGEPAQVIDDYWKPIS
jgi:hypothetical protein